MVKAIKAQSDGFFIYEIMVAISLFILALSFLVRMHLSTMSLEIKNKKSITLLEQKKDEYKKRFTHEFFKKRIHAT